MGGDALNAGVGIVTAIIGLAILSVILSHNSNTMGVIQAASGGLAADLGAAMSPVTGGGMGGSMLGSPMMGNMMGYNSTMMG